MQNISAKCLGKHLRVAVCLQLASWGYAHAATLCIAENDVQGLQGALLAAASNGEDDLIELQSGYYSMPSNYLLSYVPNGWEHHDLKIEGGYADSFGNPCALAPTAPDPRSTILDGGLLSLALPDGAGSIALQSVTVSNTISNVQVATPVRIVAGSATSTGDILIDHSIFTGNISTTSIAIHIQSGLGRVLVHDSLFASNASFGDFPISFGSFQATNPLCTEAGTEESIAACSSRSADEAMGFACEEITNSTFTNNASNAAAVRLNTGPCYTTATNSIFWGNANGDIVLDYPAMVELYNDNFGNLDEIANAHVSNVLSLNPLFNTDFSLKDLSPLRDAGIDVFLSAYDLIGNPRLFGAHADMGAYEIQDVIFANGVD